jgi:hypothetical protein
VYGRFFLRKQEGAPYCIFIINKKVLCTKRKGRKGWPKTAIEITNELIPSMRTAPGQLQVSVCIAAMKVPGIVLLCISILWVEYYQISNHFDTSRYSKS